MKKYDVTGIGNALVDIEFKVSDQFFFDNHVEKGLMTLVDENRQNALMKVINTKEAKKQCGGSAANTVIAVGQFGGNAFYCCKVANDELGHFYLKDLNESGVDIALEEDRLESGVTGKCLVMVTEDSERTMNTFLGITQNFSVRDIQDSAIKDSKYLFMEGYLVTSSNGKEAMMHAKRVAEESGTKVALTFSDPAMVKYFKSNFDDIIGASVDLLFANEEAALFLCRKLYIWFIYYKITPEVEAGVIAPLAKLLRDSNYEVKPVLKALAYNKLQQPIGTLLQLNWWKSASSGGTDH